MIAGTSSNVISGQGINILINMFFGPIFNAAYGIAYQVQGGIYKLVDNIIVAATPQIVQSYSGNNFAYMYKLVFTSAKFTFILLYLIALPIFLQTDYILSLWLEETPEYAGLFIKLILIEMLIQSTFSAIASVSQASGKIKNYQIIVSLCHVLTFCFTALFFKLSYPVYSTFIIAVIIAFIGLIARLFELKVSLSFPIKKFLSEVLLRLIVTAILSTIIPLLLMIYTEKTIGCLILSTILCLISTILVSWMIGLSNFEKEYVIVTIKKYIRELLKIPNSVLRD
jgi:O-antigen/teichoic acid export membrane protein